MPRRRLMERAPRVALVVNAEGLQEHRAAAFESLLRARFAIDVLVAPGRPGLARVARADVLYVIDAGRRGFAAGLAGRAAGKPVVVEVGDPQAALYRAQGRGRAAVAAGGAVDFLVGWRASAVVVRGRGLAESLPIRVPWFEIPDGVDLELFRPGIDGSLRRDLGIPPDVLVCGVAGSIEWAPTSGTTYGWDIVEALGRLRDEPVWGLVVGEGSGVDRLRGRARQLGVQDRLLLPGRVRHREVPRYVAAMDVCVSTQSNDDVGRGRTTAKLPEYLACDRFVLATAVGAAADVLPVDMLLPYEGARDERHPARLAERLANLAPRRAELRGGAGTRAIAAARYAYPLLAERLGRVLDGALASAQRS